jgi:hypothetical protein
LGLTISGHNVQLSDLVIVRRGGINETHQFAGAFVAYGAGKRKPKWFVLTVSRGSFFVKQVHEMSAISDPSALAKLPPLPHDTCRIELIKHASQHHPPATARSAAATPSATPATSNPAPERRKSKRQRSAASSAAQAATAATAEEEEEEDGSSTEVQEEGDGSDSDDKPQRRSKKSRGKTSNQSPSITKQLRALRKQIKAEKEKNKILTSLLAESKNAASWL